MELIYSMRRKPLKCEPPHFETVTDADIIRPLCTVSSANIIAFSSPTELEDGDAGSWGGHVYVCDLDTPWDCHKVTSTNYPVSTLEWDEEGRQLLVATTVGSVAVYGQKDFLLNDWTVLYEANFPGEHILAGIFFSGGRSVAQRKTDAPERMQYHAATLRGFGGVPQEGALIVTSSGVVGALQPPSAPQIPPDCLRSPRDTLSAAYTEHHNGRILIAYVSGVSPRCVRCASAVVSTSALSLLPLPALHLPMPAVLSWVIRDDTECLLVAGTTMSLWKLAERSYPVHKLLSKGGGAGSTPPAGGPKPPTDCFNTLVWQQCTVWSGGLGTAVGSSWRRVAAAVSQRAVYCATLDTSRITTYQLINPSPTDLVPAGGSSPKKAKYSQGNLPPLSATTVLSCVSITNCGALAVVVDSRAQLHVLSLSHMPDIAPPLLLQGLQAQLERALRGGLDCLDLLITLRPATLDALYDRITESFQRQPAAFQQYHFHRWLALRVAITRVSPNAQWSAAWLTALQALHLAWAHAAAAAAICDSDDSDNDKSLITLESKAESEAGALQALRRPLQRALDIALAAVLARRPHRAPHGYDLLSDPSAVHLLRKLTALSRGVARTPHADLASRALAGDKLSSDVIEECAALWGAAPWPAWEAPARTCISAPHGRQRPLVLQYGVTPEQLRFTPERPPQLDAAPTALMDSVRYLYLGGGLSPAKYRACGRCGSAALPAKKAPDQRYAAGCRCGGKWTLVSNI